MSDLQLSPDLVAFLREGKDRSAIEACLLRYTRGVDRLDRTLLLSAYWPDAFDEHGVTEGYAADFANWSISRHRELKLKHQHFVSNSTIELNGDTAHVETYFIFSSENHEAAPSISFGRYIDRFEKRSGEWRIAHRVCVNELVGQLSAAAVSEAWPLHLDKTAPCRQDRSDISYDRPLSRERTH